MVKLSKRQKKINEYIIAGKLYSITEAVKLLKDVSSVKFEESIDVSINLGVDPRKSDQVVRGSTVLPHGTGKSVRVAVFTQGQNANLAKECGAEIVGMEDLATEVKNGKLDFDVVIASPDAMRVVGQLGQILGPKGLMPNPKVGTVTPNISEAVRNAKSGQVRFRTDKNGIVHAGIGKMKFNPDALQDNIQTLLSELKKLKPSTSKGIYIKKITISSTMGPGLIIDLSTLK